MLLNVVLNRLQIRPTGIISIDANTTFLTTVFTLNKSSSPVICTVATKEEIWPLIIYTIHDTVKTKSQLPFLFSYHAGPKTWLSKLNTHNPSVQFYLWCNSWLKQWISTRILPSIVWEKIACDILKSHAMDGISNMMCNNWWLTYFLHTFLNRV